MTGWLFHLAVCSTGLAVAGIVLRLSASRADATTLHRLGVATLLATLGLPAAHAAIVGASWLGTQPPDLKIHEEHRVVYRGKERPPPLLKDIVAALPQGATATADTSNPEWPLALYAAGLGAVGLYHARRFGRTLAFLRGCRPCVDAGTWAVWQRIADGSPLRNRVRLLAGPGLAAPCCWGLLRPCLVLPEGGCKPDDLEWAMRHELAHLERRDARTAVAQAILTSLFWFHPVAWWLSRRLDEWCELSCDQTVVARTGRRKRYALALLEFATRLHDAAERPPALRAGMLHGADSHMRRRIAALASRPVTTGSQHGWIVAAVLALTWCGQLVFAAVPATAPRRPSEIQRLQDVEVFWWRADKSGRR